MTDHNSLLLNECLFKNNSFSIYSASHTELSQSIIKIYDNSISSDYFNIAFDELVSVSQAKHLLIPKKSLFNGQNAIEYQLHTLIPLSAYLGSIKNHYEAVVLCFLIIAKELKELYTYRSGHFQLTPYNILWDTETHTCKFIFPESENKRFHFDERYRSPEQTQLTKREITWSSDLYSLGIIMYEALYTHPFVHAQNDVPIDQVNLAQKVKDLYRVHKHIPESLSSIIKKCLKKISRNRYNTITSLIADLEQIKKNLYITTFSPGELNYINTVSLDLSFPYFNSIIRDIQILVIEDTVDKFGVIKLIYETETIKDIFCKKLSHNFEEQNILHFYIHAEHDTKNIAYYTISHLLKDIVSYINNSIFYPSEIIDSFVNNTNSFALNILINLCPDFQHLFSIDISKEQTTIIQDEKMIFTAVYHFLNFIAKTSQAIVIQTDNIENIDNESIGFLIDLINRNDLMGITFIYSNNTDNKKSNRQISQNSFYREIVVAPLEEKEVQSLLSNALHTAHEKISTLSSLVYTRTKGCPLGLHHFFKNAIEKNHLYYAALHNGWKWDEDTLQNTFFSTDYDYLIANTISQCNAELQQALAHAALFGVFFDSNIIATLLHSDSDHISLLFREAIALNLIIPVPQYNGMSNDNFKVLFKFTNRKISEIALKTMPLDEDHLKKHIFNHILNDYSKIEHYALFFNSFIEKNAHVIGELTKENQYKLLEYFLHQARSYRFLNKLGLAEHYCKKSISLHKDDSWQNNYDRTKQLFHCTIELCILKNKLNRVNHYFEIVFSKIDNAKDLIPFYDLLIQVHMKRSENEEAIKLIKKILTLHGIDIERKGLFKIMKDKLFFYLFKNRLLNNEFQYVPEVNSNSDDIVTKYNSYLMNLDKELYLHSIFTIRNKAFFNGIKSAYYLTFLKYSRYLIEEANKLEYGICLAKTIYERIKHSDDFDDIVSKMYYFKNIAPYSLPYRDSCSFFNESYLFFENYGNISKANECFFQYSVRSIIGSINLPKLQHELHNYLASHKKHLHKKDEYYLLSTFRNQIAQLINTSPIKKEYKIKQQPTPNEEASVWLQLSSLLYAFYNGESEKTISAARNINRSPHVVHSRFLMMFFDFYELLAHFSIWNTIVPEEEKKGIIAKYRKVLKSLRELSVYNSSNFSEKFHLLQAEYHRVTGNNTKAMYHFEKAIYFSEKYKNLTVAALASKLFAQFFSSQGDLQNASTYYIKSYNYFKIWGSQTLGDELKFSHFSIFEEREIRIYDI